MKNGRILQASVFLFVLTSVRCKETTINTVQITA